MIQLHVCRRDNRLCAIIRFRRHRDDWLHRMFRFAFVWKLGMRCASVERREVFRRIVINHI